MKYKYAFGLVALCAFHITHSQSLYDYFPAGSTWTQDISQAPLDNQSASIIEGVRTNGGFGTGRFQMDFSIEVLEGNSTTSFKSFTPTDNFFSDECNLAAVPVPTVGALEGETNYACAGDGDCHLIVIHRPTKKLYEMWRANIIGNNFQGGCLAIWDLTRVYGPTGRGDDCGSADAAGLPMAPLLFSPAEVQAGEIKHAIRFALPNDRIQHLTYVHPGTHATKTASGGADTPPYGSRWRLRANFPLDSLPNAAARTVAKALKTYGMFLADGGNIALMGQSDQFSSIKWNGLLGTRDLDIIKVTDFEIVDGGAKITWKSHCDLNAGIEPLAKPKALWTWQSVGNKIWKLKNASAQMSVSSMLREK